MNGTFKDLSIFLVFPGDTIEWGVAGEAYNRHGHHGSFLPVRVSRTHKKFRGSFS